MKQILAVAVVAVLLLSSRGQDAGAEVPAPQQTPQTTPTTSELEQRDQPVTNDDLRILLKADALLKDESVWNRKDDRECDDDEATDKRSLFCALQKACIDVLGSVRSSQSGLAGGSLRRGGCDARSSLRTSAQRFQQPANHPACRRQEGFARSDKPSEIALGEKVTDKQGRRVDQPSAHSRGPVPGSCRRRTRRAAADTETEAEVPHQEAAHAYSNRVIGWRALLK